MRCLLTPAVLLATFQIHRPTAVPTARHDRIANPKTPKKGIGEISPEQALASIRNERCAMKPIAESEFETRRLLAQQLDQFDFSRPPGLPVVRAKPPNRRASVVDIILRL
jgi:hypothetical protein